MRIFVITLSLLLATATGWAQPESAPDQLFKLGLKKYHAGEFKEGLDYFSAALQQNPSPPVVDPSLIHYNLGIGYYRLSQPDKAAKSFQDALRNPDIALQSSTYFNLGNALYQQAQALLNEGDVAPAFRLFQNAATNYMESLRLRHDDRDAKVNYELSVVAQMRILQMVAMAMSRLQQGEQMIDQFKFIEAAQWFQQNLPVVEKALSLEPDMKKQFETMTERSSAVAEILMPSVQPGGQP